MPSTTYTPIATTTLTGTDTEILFSNIPNSFKDLVLISNFRFSTAGGVVIQCNSDTVGPYPIQTLYSTGTTVLSHYENYSASQLSYYVSFDQNYPGAFLIHFMDYSATDRHKNFICRASSVHNSGTCITAGRYASNSAISSFKIYSGTRLFQPGDKFSLFGIEA